MEVRDLSSETVPGLGAHVGMCQPAGGSNVELMAPSDPDASLSMALQRFLDRRGTGLYALMLEAADPDAEAEELALRGLNVLPLMPGASGRDLHPNSTHGVLIRVYPTGSVAQPGAPTTGPLGIGGIARVVVAVHDAGAAAKTYGHGLGLTTTQPARDRERGVMVCHATPPEGAVIELVAPVDVEHPFAAAIAAHLDAKGEGMVALVLGASDPAESVAGLVNRGMNVDVAGPLGPEFSLFGTRLVLAES